MNIKYNLNCSILWNYKGNLIYTRPHIRIYLTHSHTYTLSFPPIALSPCSGGSACCHWEWHRLWVRGKGPHTTLGLFRGAFRLAGRGLLPLRCGSVRQDEGIVRAGADAERRQAAGVAGWPGQLHLSSLGGGHPIVDHGRPWRRVWGGRVIHVWHEGWVLYPTCHSTGIGSHVRRNKTCQLEMKSDCSCGE